LLEDLSISLDGKLSGFRISEPIAHFGPALLSFQKLKRLTVPMETLFNSETGTLLEPDGVLPGFISTINILDATPDVVAWAERLLACKHSGLFRALNALEFKNGQAGERSVADSLETASIWSKLEGEGVSVSWPPPTEV
jgi:hypothetical protein